MSTEFKHDRSKMKAEIRRKGRKSRSRRKDPKTYVDVGLYVESKDEESKESD